MTPNPRKHSLYRPHWHANARQFIIRPLVVLAIFGLAMVHLLMQPSPVQAGGILTVSILAADNLVVDSNVLSPSTYAPSVATVGGKFCNTGDSPLSNLQGFIGNYTANTPGVYPARSTADAAFQTQHPLLVQGGGSYAFAHIGGRAGVADATRYIGSLAAGECKVEYWHFSYPRRENPGNTGPDPVWGLTRDPSDDLWLTFDVWGAADGGAAASAARKMTMRNEISAMANKIKPNPAGRWFNTDAEIVPPGETITSNGILYDLGVPNKGFDNDGNFTYDYNAWMQPFGAPTFDPSCFRLIRTSTTITVSRSGGNPTMIINATDQLYFTNLPDDTNGAIGNVAYTFLALGGPCSLALSPYQEVASGADNEKFNGDYGTGIPPVASGAVLVEASKLDSPDPVALGGAITYQIPFTNTGTAPAGRPDYGVPVVISDTIPTGMQYAASSADTVNNTPNGGYNVRYSTDNGLTWSTGEPSAASVTNIQWWLKAQLAASASGKVQFQVTVPDGYSGTPLVPNAACLSFGGGACFANPSATTLVTGSNSVSGQVWKDENRNGAKDDGANMGIGAITLKLYYDADGDGALDATDTLLKTTESAATPDGTYSFTGLPDGKYLVQVDAGDTSLPTGYVLTTSGVLAADLDSGHSNPSGVAVNDRDFGFAPILKLAKSLTTASPAGEGSPVTFSLLATNTRPGTSAGGYCAYTVYAAAEDAAHTGSGQAAWTNAAAAFGSTPDTSYASSTYNSAADKIAGKTFTINSSQIGVITKVEAVFSVYYTGTFVDDKQQALLWYSGAQVGTTKTFDTATLSAFQGQAKQGLLAWDVTSLRTWNWSDFANATLNLEMDAVKTSSADNVKFYLDGMGFQITSDQQCAGSADTIVVLPVTDTYDSARLQYLSADPLPDSTTPAGTLTWNNVGPLRGGETKPIAVTFKALDPGAASAGTINTVAVNGAKFGDGRDVNSATANASVTVNRTGKIGDFIWQDLNNNSIWDTGEPGIPGVTVRLCAAANCNPVVATTVTDANGAYLFENVADGSYVVDVTATGAVPGTETNTFDKDGNKNSQTPVTISGGADVLDADFGFRITNTIYGTIWKDASGDGTRQTGENGIETVTVYLCTATPCTSSNQIQITTTDANGYYQFTGMANNTYYLGISTSGTLASYTNTVDPEGMPGNSQSAAIVLNNATGAAKGAYDFGYQPTGSATIGDTIFNDWDGDGTQDTGDTGIANVAVRLYLDTDGSGAYTPGTDALVGTTTTDANGLYQFTNRPNGTYYVVVDHNGPDLPLSYVQTADPDETDVCITCNSRGTAVVSGSSITTMDFGYKPVGYGSIGDRVWQDTNGDGVQDTGEAGLAGIKVTLYADSNNNGTYEAGSDALIGERDTDSSGLYLFGNLPAGKYLVKVDTTDGDLPKDGLGLAYLASTATTQAVTLAAPENYATADFGFTPGAAVGSLIWKDNNGDGTPNAGEPGIAGVTVTLYRDANGNGVYDSGVDTQHGSTTTDSTGHYLFAQLPAGDYVVVVSPPAGTLTGDPDQGFVGRSGDSQSGFNLIPGQADYSRNFGYQPAGVIGDSVWLDMNSDGVRDANEAGLPGVKVDLKDGGGTVIDTIYTDPDGYYTFGGLANGAYTVVVNGGVTPTGMAQIYDPDQPSSHPCATCDNQGSATISGGGSVMTVDFGYRYNGPYNISGTAFYDAGNDGGLYQTGTDTPYGGTTVYLWRGSALIGETQTDANGLYTFANLPNGSYTVSVNRNAPQLEGLTLNSPTPNAYRAVTLSDASVTQQDFGFFGQMDYGDLLATYALTQLGDEGARHTIGNLRLGAGISPDADGQESATANKDTYDDGVICDTSTSWTPGSSVDLNVAVTGSGGYLAGWFDWNNDGDFGDAAEMVEFGTVSNGANALAITVPVGYPTGQTVNARFRLYSGDPGTPAANGLATNGEVEDYQWSFAPTAVTLIGFATHTAQAIPGGWLVGLIGVMLLSVAVVRWQRKRTT